MGTRYKEAPFFLKEELWKIANYLMSPGKGILAMDQSEPSMGLKLQEIFVDNTEENRCKFRHLVLQTSDDLGQYLSGIILIPEAFNDIIPEGENIVQILKKKGIVSGIRLDVGLLPLVGSEREFFSAGLTDLSDLCDTYKKLECHFAKWRCVYRIGSHLPSLLALNLNSDTLAKFASICQSHRLVPIIEPEILPEGKHSLVRAQQISEIILANLFKSLHNHHVYLEGLILKINFVTPGMQRKITYSPEEIASTTITVLNRTVPAAVMGVIFLAGGSCEDVATSYLDAVNNIVSRSPWPMSFSYGRGMLTSTLAAWSGNDENVEDARKVLLERARINSLATLGKYKLEKEKEELAIKEKKEKNVKLGKDKKIITHRYYDRTN